MMPSGAGVLVDFACPAIQRRADSAVGWFESTINLEPSTVDWQTKYRGRLG